MQQLTTSTLLHGGTYRIEKVLGQGSFGITYLAVHTSLGKKVAIKEFFMKELNSRSDDGSITGLTDGSLSYNYARKFKKEAQNLAHLEHSNIVRVTDCFDENGTFYYVMDYIEGDNLNDYIKYNHISQDEAISIITDVAKALQYMHEEKHMLHLDLKPGNIMRRSSDGHIFLIDFGLSKHYSSDGQPETSTTIGLGTAGYAPIEQANQAKNGEFRPTIDVYALGATLYKLVTLETPPAASELVSDDELLSNNLKKHNITGDLADVIIKAMLPNVRKRIQTVTAFVNILEQSNINRHTIGQESDSESTIFVNTDMPNNNAEFKTAMSLYDKGQYEQAFPLLERLANSGMVDAMYRLGVCYYWDEGIERSNPKSINFSKCVEWMSKAAKLGNSNAMLWLGSYMYSNGEGTIKDDTKALEYTKMSADAGNNSAKVTIGTYYLTGQYVEIDEEKGSQLIHQGYAGLQKKASFLSREEMHMFAMCYHIGLGVDENIQKAIQWYNKAAELGDPEAQNSLGEIYLNGAEGVPEDETKALKLFKLSAKKNLTGALKNVADCYYYGWGTSKNYSESIKWYTQAAEEGSDEAMVMIGLCYRNGNGVKENYKKAEEWFLKAKHKTNSAEAINYLGLIYEEGGNGLLKDQVKATKYYKDAALQGYAAGQYNYGISLINGEGVTANVDKGIEWVQKAADQDFKEAIDFLNSLDDDDENDSASNVSSVAETPSSSSSITSAPTDGRGFFVNNEYVNTTDNSVSLNTLNGWGTTLKGHYREAESTYVAYEFFCAFWLPLIPIGCYRVKDADGDSYLIYGSTEWHMGEVLLEYLKWWGGGILLIVIINLLANR